MIYAEETLNLMPASPETIEAFVSFSEEKLVPRSERLGARLVAAWSSNADACSQVMNVWEFDDLAAFGAFRAKGSDDETWLSCQERQEELASEQSTRLTEALGPVPAAVLAKASAQVEGWVGSSRVQRRLYRLCSSASSRGGDNLAGAAVARVLSVAVKAKAAAAGDRSPALIRDRLLSEHDRCA